MASDQWAGEHAPVAFPTDSFGDLSPASNEWMKRMLASSPNVRACVEEAMEMKWLQPVTDPSLLVKMRAAASPHVAARRVAGGTNPAVRKVRTAGQTVSLANWFMGAPNRVQRWPGTTVVSQPIVAERHKAIAPETASSLAMSFTAASRSPGKSPARSSPGRSPGRSFTVRGPGLSRSGSGVLGSFKALRGIAGSGSFNSGSFGRGSRRARAALERHRERVQRRGLGVLAGDVKFTSQPNAITNVAVLEVVVPGTDGDAAAVVPVHATLEDPIVHYVTVLPGSPASCQRTPSTNTSKGMMNSTR